MIIDMFKRSGKKREKEKWASSSETAFPFEKRPLLAGKFCPFSLPPPPPLLLFLLAFLCALLTSLSTEKRKCFSLILTYPLGYPTFKHPGPERLDPPTTALGTRSVFPF